MEKDTLLKMIADDDLGLLLVKPQASSAISADERLLSSFQEINEFLRLNGREPDSGQEIREHQLATRLKSIREDEKKRESLLMYDEFGLLASEQKTVASIDDILQDDDLGLLDTEDESLFRIENVPDIQERGEPDFIARRTICEDFDIYESLFKKCHQELSSGERRLIPFVESRMVEGDFFVLDGVLLLLVKIYDPYRGNSNKINRRTYCVYENSTESNALLRSLGKALSENGYAVSRGSQTENDSLFAFTERVNDGDVKTGFIYILKSLSTDEKITGLDNLYKIGFSNVPVEDRIKNASEEPTYLMAPVSIVRTYECYNFNPQKLEQLLHNFFGSSCLNVDIFDTKNQRHMPREWFIAPLQIIEQAIELILSGGIVSYKYDPTQEKIILRK